MLASGYSTVIEAVVMSSQWRAHRSAISERQMRRPLARVRDVGELVPDPPYATLKSANSLY